MYVSNVWNHRKRFYIFSSNVWKPTFGFLPTIGTPRNLKNVTFDMPYLLCRAGMGEDLSHDSRGQPWRNESNEQSEWQQFQSFPHYKFF